MRRTAKPGEFRSNLHRGGKGARLSLPRSYRSAAIRAAKAMGLEVAGVDMLEGREGPRILEINSSPGLEGIERATGVDVASAIIDHAERYARDNRKITKRALEKRIGGVIDDERRAPRPSEPERRVAAMRRTLNGGARHRSAP
jgi:ribosomal protein S6--L-glutamate ligase